MNLKQFRCKQGYTQSEVADLIGVSPSAYAMYERGEREPSIELLYKLSMLLNANIYSLCGFDTSHFENNISPDEPKLNEGEKAVLDLFRTIPEEHQALALEIVKGSLSALQKK